MQDTIIIIGGLSAGPSAAAKARRVNENVNILLFEKTDYISYATCGIPYSLSGTIKSRDKLMVVSADLLRERFNIDVHLNEPVLVIDPVGHTITTPLGKYTYTKLIYAAGAKPFIPPVKNIENTSNWSNCRTIEDFDKICQDNVLTDKQNITIIGAGLIGVEVAENLNKIGKNVTVIELSPSILPAWDSKFGNMAETVMHDKGIDIFTNTTASELILDNNEITDILLNDGTKVKCDYLLVGIGGKPNSELLINKGADYIRNGAIKVNEKMETSLPDIYAAGDCASIKNIQTGEFDYFPMGTHANKGGRAAGANAAGGNERFKGAYKTAIVKVFEYTLARTGFNRRALKMMNLPFESTFIIAPSTPGFYPNPKDMYMELHYHRDSRTLLGGEIFGEKGVDKRIDVLSTAILGKLTVDDLPDLDLAYAPPFSPAKDPVIVAGLVSGDKAKYDFKEISADDLYMLANQTKATDFQLIDVRTALELETEGRIFHATNIPLDELRLHMDELDKELPVYIYCARGLRGYVASMILVNHGFKKVFNLGGGFKAWQKLGLEVKTYSTEY